MQYVGPNIREFIVTRNYSYEIHHTFYDNTVQVGESPYINTFDTPR